MFKAPTALYAILEKQKGRNIHFKGRKKGWKDVLNSLWQKIMYTAGLRLFSVCCSSEMTLGEGTKAQNSNEICPASDVGTLSLKDAVKCKSSVWNFPEQAPCFVPSLPTVACNRRTCKSAAGTVRRHFAMCWQLHLLTMMIYYTACWPAETTILWALFKLIQLPSQTFILSNYKRQELIDRGREHYQSTASVTANESKNLQAHQDVLHFISSKIGEDSS